MLKRVVFRTIVLILLITIIRARYNISVLANPKTITVPSPGYETIQKAIDAASPEDVIMVTNGIYHENLMVNKTISLIGQNCTTTVVDGGDLKDVVIVNSPSVTIAGFTILNGKKELPYCGIRVFGCNFVRVNNVILKNNFFGLQLTQSNNCTIHNTIIANNSYAGIKISSSSNNVFFQSIIANNSFGLQSFNSPFNVFYHNNFINNTISQVWMDDESTPMTLNNGAEGNYWSDYVGSDLDMDGTGDSRYSVLFSWDNHPLMGMFTNFTFYYDSQEYFLSTICNSTTSNFKFDKTLGKISFDVLGSSGTVGFCRISAPKTLIQGNYTILIEGNALTYSRNWTSLTYSYCYFMYKHIGTAQNVTILLKFPENTVQPFPIDVIIIITFWSIVAIFAAVILIRRKKGKF